MTLTEALRQAQEALEEYDAHTSPFADDWAALAHNLKVALEDLQEAIEGEVQ